jgi:hypothetical protein
MKNTRNTLHDVLVHAKSLQVMSKPKSRQHELSSFIVEKITEILATKQQNWIGLTIQEMLDSEHYFTVATSEENDRTVDLLLFVKDMEAILEQRNHGRI